MKTKITLITLLSFALAGLVSAQSNTAAGAAVGAVAGAAIGAHNKAPVAGAVTGAIVGGLIGNAVDQNQQARYSQPPPPPPVVVAERPVSPSPTVVYTYGPADAYGRPTYVIVQTWNGTSWVQQTYAYDYFLSWHDRRYGPRPVVRFGVGFGHGPHHGPRHHW